LTKTYGRFAQGMCKIEAKDFLLKTNKKTNEKLIIRKFFCSFWDVDWTGLGEAVLRTASPTTPFKGTECRSTPKMDKKEKGV